MAATCRVGLHFPHRPHEGRSHRPGQDPTLVGAASKNNESDPVNVENGETALKAVLKVLEREEREAERETVRARERVRERGDDN